MNDIKLFSGNSNPALGKQISDYLGVELAAITLGRFPDGEISCKIDEDIRGRDVFLLQPTSPPVNESLMELLGKTSGYFVVGFLQLFFWMLLLNSFNMIAGNKIFG